MGADRKELGGYIFDTWNAPWGRCLAPGPECSEEVIGAHSVQRGGPLSLLAADGHVTMLRQRLRLDAPPEVDFQSVGLRRATTFTGLCATHDQELFRHIDTQPFAPDDATTLLLHAYRAVLRETHATGEAGVKLQLAYQKKGDLGLVDRSRPSPEGMFALERLMVAYETWTYKTQFDQEILQETGSFLTHDVIDLGPTGPCVAVSSLFSLDEPSEIDESMKVCLTVLPTEAGRTFALFSYVSPDAEKARRALAPILGSSGDLQRYRLSRLILEMSDNIAFSPAHVATWSELRRTAIREFFVATILHSADPQFQDGRLNLFGDVFEPAGRGNHDGSDQGTMPTADN